MDINANVNTNQDIKIQENKKEKVKPFRSRKWNLETMNNYCKENAIGYKVLDTKIVEKTYQNQLWALVKCPNERHEEYWMWWNNFVNKDNKCRCKECDYVKNNKTKWTHEKVIDFYDKYGYKVENVEDFKDVDQSLICYDNNGFMYSKSITSLKQRKSHESRKLKIMFNISNKDGDKINIYNINHYIKLFANDYEYLEDRYYGIKKEVRFKYLGSDLPDTEDRVFKVTVDGFVNGGVRHPYFSMTQGEKIFRDLLREHSINFVEQKTFPDCRYKSVLFFDFYLPDYKIAVEIDGIQHIKPIEYFGGEAGFKESSLRDSIKNEYCKGKGIVLERILYESNKKKCFINRCNEFIFKIKDLIIVKESA